MDTHRGHKDAKPYPLWIKPDKKLSLREVFRLMRDHYEDTPMDMTKGLDAGPFGSPNRWRPMTWKVDGVDYSWERPISTQQTGFSFVSQSRDWLPDPIGGVYWYGLDDTYTNCYVPLYCCIDALPESYTTGSLSRFSWDSAWWTFNFVANFANLKYSYMIQDIRAVQQELEGQLMALQPAVERTAAALHETDKKLMKRYLTDYSVSHAETVKRKWQDLGEYLIAKYNDGYVQDTPGNAQEKGYPQAWLRELLKLRPEAFKLKKWKKEAAETELPF
jgi:dipeptidase